MSGTTFAEKAAEQRNLLIDLGFTSDGRGCAVDLGCGPGYQALALSEVGYGKVIAIDTSEALLGELRAASQDESINTVLADLRDIADHVGEGTADAIVCMGDTITHLQHRNDVSKLLGDAYRALRSGGRLALTYRDFSLALTGTDRFIPVRSDDQRIMTCVLDYEADHVVVTDLIYLRTDAEWQLQKSSYRKLRLAPSWVADMLCQAGYSVEVDAPIGRMQTVVARKP
ncbi:class I SAM-dependent methyltransferase [Sphingomonas endophytica]|uniref:SAM-dependent methyltransferase n=1 Tax=Sphingomonas endophytica TaxID=869719 RepID=A0ABR6N5L2_9SPHN|nr:class I SAM-dependent methyltransferase [Sphingomonas endophytica]MBB5726073.1 SAM-dependent methyltransferase [Sphingomonas endophytica]